MDITLINNFGGGVEVWLSEDGRDPTKFEPGSGVLIGEGKTTDVALSDAVANLGEVVQELANRQRLSAVEGYKQREPV